MLSLTESTLLQMTMLGQLIQCERTVIRKACLHFLSDKYRINYCSLRLAHLWQKVQNEDVIKDQNFKDDLSVCVTKLMCGRIVDPNAGLRKQDVKSTMQL